mmetsp:Transcript_12117/g.29711  ORF Transcript_12117/g.29711 Transcript_12117/m.29711 type:complete len:262 (-) Transcript_12117:118-903(-)
MLPRATCSDQMGPLCAYLPFQMMCGTASRRFHVRMVWSLLPVYSSLPTTCRHSTVPSWPRYEPFHSPSFHTRTQLSVYAAYTRRSVTNMSTTLPGRPSRAHLSSTSSVSTSIMRTCVPTPMWMTPLTTLTLRMASSCGGDTRGGVCALCVWAVSHAMSTPLVVPAYRMPSQMSMHVIASLADEKHAPTSNSSSSGPTGCMTVIEPPPPPPPPPCMRAGGSGGGSEDGLMDAGGGVDGGGAMAIVLPPNGGSTSRLSRVSSR